MSGSSSRHRGHRQCDQCGNVEEADGPQFQTCGGCLMAQYCSSTCQRLQWPSHKAVCTYTRNARNADESGVTRSLRKFTSAFEPLLGWAGFQALQLKRVPSNIRQQALLLDLAPNDRSKYRFAVQGARLVPRTYVSDAPVVEEIQRREERCRQSGGLGVCLIVLQCGELATQVMPVELDRQCSIIWEHDDNWYKTLTTCVENGLTAFPGR
ncbi:hypothetical protein CYLTODRAFT_392936 [Cylindrobasidium torrendii FP15055 ss-10]|uniref:MYND-type domain-containing protein n=1 Tax=Cylindrobasidium torrendii FP15055 ss-10 TaxID=1314674 RepID=A0A0D7BJQ3_9AGAR|nr:hypothetical protein CYLTODRAFT_392936 [Cylindrobasidium torrendii FP15055 ss-10]